MLGPCSVYLFIVSVTTFAIDAAKVIRESIGCKICVAALWSAANLKAPRLQVNELPGQDCWAAEEYPLLPL